MGNDIRSNAENTIFRILLQEISFVTCANDSRRSIHSDCRARVGGETIFSALEAKYSVVYVYGSQTDKYKLIKFDL